MDKNRKPYPVKARERIKASQIIDKLHLHVDGKVEMTGTQIQAARILLNKALPDLSAVEHSGDWGSKPVRAMTTDELMRELERYRSKTVPDTKGTGEAETGEDQRGSVH